MKSIKYILCSAVLASMLTTTGCSVFSVYKIDLPQGTPLAQTEASKLKLGMTKNQVLYLIGSPAIMDTLAPNRWDYIYDYQPGTYGKRENKPVITDAQQHLVIYFDNNDLVSQIEGLESLPITRQAVVTPAKTPSKWYWPF